MELVTSETKSTMDFIMFVATLAFGFITWYYARVAENFSRAANRLAMRSTTDQRFGQIMAWGGEVVDAVEHAIHMCLHVNPTTSSTFFDDRVNALSDLSALIDRGRWLFPNLRSEVHESNKEPAFQGYRQDVLNLVALAHATVRSISYKKQDDNKIPYDRLVTIERKFVNLIQDIVDPRARDKEYSKLLGLPK